MNNASKSALQKKVLGLDLGLTAKDIVFHTWPAVGGGWLARVHVGGHMFRSKDSAGRKRAAEQLAAKAALDHWSSIKSFFMLGDSVRDLPIREDDGPFLPRLIGRGDDPLSEEEEEYDPWYDDHARDDDGEELEKLYLELGRHTYEQHRLLAEIDRLRAAE